MFFLNCHYSQSHSFLFKFSVISNLIVLFNRIYKINLSIYLISFSLNIIRFNRFVTLNLKKHRKTNNKNKILISHWKNHPNKPRAVMTFSKSSSSISQLPILSTISDTMLVFSLFGTSPACEQNIPLYVKIMTLMW